MFNKYDTKTIAAFAIFVVAVIIASFTERSPIVKSLVMGTLLMTMMGGVVYVAMRLWQGMDNRRESAALPDEVRSIKREIATIKQEEKSLRKTSKAVFQKLVVVFDADMAATRASGEYVYSEEQQQLYSELDILNEQRQQLTMRKNRLQAQLTGVPVPGENSASVELAYA